MNVIKEFYITHLKDQLPEIEQAFPWRLANIPTIGRFTGIFLLAIAFLTSMTFGIAVHFFYIFLAMRAEYPIDALQQSISPSLFMQAYVTEAAVAVIGGLAHALYYRAATTRPRKTSIKLTTPRQMGLDT